MKDGAVVKILWLLTGGAMKASLPVLGITWQFKVQVEDEHRYTAVFARCGIYDYLNSRGMAHIAPAMCAVDYLFGECSNHWFLREFTIATGRIIKGCGPFIIGLFIASMGVAFSTKAGLGTSPVASVPYSISLVSSLLSFGGWLNLFSVVQIITQVAVLKGKCNYTEIAIQTVLAFVYGYLTNLSVWLIREEVTDHDEVYRKSKFH